jgi:hypothetical protein
MRKLLSRSTPATLAIRLVLLLSLVLLTIVNTIRPAAAACGTTNLALNKTVTASSSQSGLPATNAVDGNTTTRWSSDWADPQWIQVDLGSSQTLCGVTLNWEAAYARNYTVQISTNATTWTTVYTTTTDDGGIDALTITGTGRYVRGATRCLSFRCMGRERP